MQRKRNSIVIRTWTVTLLLPWLAGAAACGATLRHDPATLRCATPFSVPVRSDDGHGMIPASCVSIAAAPPPPPYAANVLPSCANTTATPPPQALASFSCTYGILTDRGNAYFLCPKTATLPENADAAYQWLPEVHNGCFGDAMDAAYGYVWRLANTEGGRRPPTPHGGCGADCAAP
jgi:hypothetical protein